jgi:hypothetical protein
LEAEFCRSFAEIVQSVLFVLFFIGLALLDVGRAGLEHAVEQSCELVSAAVNGRWYTQSGSDASVPFVIRPESKESG